MDRLEAMLMLITVTETGSFSAAARTLKVPLATLSRRISDLETLLGTRLLTRTTRKLALTDTGMAYVEAARHILEQVEAAENEAAGEFTVPKGELVITSPIMFGRLHVLPVVSGFLAKFPEINIRLHMSDRNVDLIDDHVDMAVRIGKLPDSTMIATQIGEMRTVTCASPALLAGQGRPRHPDDLLRMPCVTFDTPLPSPAWRFMSRARDTDTAIDVPVHPRLSVTTAEAVVQAAISGVGITHVLHYQVAEAIKQGQLEIVLEAFEPDPAPVHLVHASRGRMPLKMRSFLDFAVPRLREVLKQISVQVCDE